MHEFETHVDRMIAALQVTPLRKLEIRRELLNHLRCAYEEEFARVSDHERACTIALERLGDPANLRLDLQSGIPVTDLIIRSARRTLLMVVVQALVFLPIFLILTPDPEMKIFNESITQNLGAFARPFLAGQFVIAFNLFLIGLFLEWIDVRSQAVASRWLVTGIKSAVPFVILLASGSLYALLAGASAYSVIFVTRWTAISLSIAFAIPFCVALLKRESSHFQNWQRTPTLVSE